MTEDALKAAAGILKRTGDVAKSWSSSFLRQISSRHLHRQSTPQPPQLLHWLNNSPP